MSKKKYTLSQVTGDAVSKEDMALRKFKERLSDVITTQDDHSLTKWLKARNYDVGKAEAMFRESMAYREKMKVDTLLADYEPPEVLTKYMSGGLCGHDKDGSPVRVELYGRLDMKGLMYSSRKVDLEKFKLKQNENILKDWELMSEKLGRRVDQLTVLFDMEGVSTKMLWRPGLQMYLYLVRMLEDNYPEMLKRMFVVNAPRIFPLMYRIARPLVSDDTRNKIHILGANYAPTLLKYIDAEELPAYLGGTKTDPDGNPRCETWINPGGQVPEKYYLNNSDESCCQHMTHTTVSRGDQLAIDQEVTVAGSVLRWEFKTDGYDIGFGVYRVDGKEKVAVIPVERVNSHMVPEDGSYTCDVPGKFRIVFDNSFSWTRNKRLWYSLDIIAPVLAEVSQDVDQMLGDEATPWQDDEGGKVVMG